MSFGPDLRSHLVEVLRVDLIGPYSDGEVPQSRYGWGGRARRQA